MYVKKKIIFTFFCLSSLIQAEFQQSWQEDMRDYLSKKLCAETIQNILKDPYLSRVQKEAIIEKGIQFSIQEFTKLRAEEFLEKNIQNDHLLSIIEHMKKKYNFSEDVFFKKGNKDNNVAFYNRKDRIINLNEKYLLGKKSSLGLLTFVLLHEIGHLRQHEKFGFLKFEEKSNLEKKDLEEDADKFAISHFCKKCRQALKEEIINMNYFFMPVQNSVQPSFVHEKLRKAYITLGFQSEQDYKEKISQIAKKGLQRVALKLYDKSYKKIEKLLEDMKNKKIILEARPSKDYLSKEEFLKEMDSVETEECLCCKFIGQENLHTVPNEL